MQGSNPTTGAEVPVSASPFENYKVKKGEEHLFHVVIENKRFNRFTGARESTPRVQKFGRKIFEQIHKALVRMGTTVRILHDPIKWEAEQAAKAEAEQAAKAEAEAAAKAEAEQAAKAEAEQAAKAEAEAAAKAEAEAAAKAEAEQAAKAEAEAAAKAEAEAAAKAEEVEQSKKTKK